MNTNDYGTKPSVQEKLKGKSLRVSKPVIQFTSDGKQVRVFSGFSEAATSIGGLPKQISHAARGISKTAYGYKWKIPGRAVDLYPVD